MVGYTEALTDPSHKSQILTLTFPLVGNYGVPDEKILENGFSKWTESRRIWAAGMIVGENCNVPSHWNMSQTLSEWLQKEGNLFDVFHFSRHNASLNNFDVKSILFFPNNKGIPGIEGIDTRQLTKKLREQGTMLGKIVIEGTESESVAFVDPAKTNLVQEVSITKPMTINPSGKIRILAVDCGLKYNQIRCLISRGARVDLVPWDFDMSTADDAYDGIFLSNGPGDPQKCDKTVQNIRKLLKSKPNMPIFGICLGHQLLSVAIGCETKKMNYGHRGHNQPCQFLKTNRY